MEYYANLVIFEIFLLIVIVKINFNNYFLKRSHFSNVLSRIIITEDTF